MVQIRVGDMVRILVEPHVDMICQVQDYKCTPEGGEKFLTHLGWFKSYQIELEE